MSSPDPDPIRVLLVDDDPSVLKAVSAALSLEFTVVTCSSAEQAITAVADGDFDVIVTDWQMPGTDGVSLLTAVHQRGSRAAGIVLTGHEKECRAALANQEKAARIILLPKSIDPLRLIDQIHLFGKFARAKRLLRSTAGRFPR